MTTQSLDVCDKYTNEVFASVAMADKAIIDASIGQAVQSFETMKRLPSFARKEILEHCVKRFRQRSDELADILCREAGKPIRDSRGEVARLIDTFQCAAEESVRIGGEVIPLDVTQRTKGYSGQWRRFPIGPCSFISPFNFPLNLAAHKIAPAIAAGCPFILKPASLTPIGALLLGEILAETDLPPGAWSILPCSRDGADLFTTDPRLKLLSFTGSPAVGWDLKARAGKKKVVLELGGNAACVIDSDSDVRDVVDRLVIGAFYQSGQSCISVQRVLIHHAIYDEVRDAFVRATLKLKAGDPKLEDTFIGPMISLKEAERLCGWIQTAVENGAHLLCGGKLSGLVLEPTLLENVPKNLAICSDEAFGPVAVLSPFVDFDQALAEVNDSPFGLQAGIFTRDIKKIYQAWETLDVGGVVIGDVPSWRADHMPYGGVKDSGLGREGIRYAIEDMTEIRMLVVRL